jgi:flagella basal body P-ring formation protein FlgA
MRCCVRSAVFCIAAFAPVSLHGQGIGEQATKEPTHAVGVAAADASADVAAAIAERWGVDAPRVVVELISLSGWPAAGTPFRLTGSGRDGRWAVWFEEDDAARQLLVRAGVKRLVVTAARDLERGTALVATDLSGESSVEWGPPSSREPAVEPGWMTRRRITKGEELRRPAVEPPNAVKAGDDVTIEAVYGSITLTLTGRVSGSAAVGETVQVRAQTGRRMEAVVIGPGLVRVGTTREEM